MQITIIEIKKAQYDEEIFERLFNEVFCNINEWLYNNGIHRDHEDLKELMYNTFFDIIRNNKYNNSTKYSFINWCRIKFKFVITDYYRNKACDVRVINNLDKIDHTYNISDDVHFDFDYIVSLMNHRSSFIANCLYYNGWNRLKIMDYMGIKNEQYNYHIKLIRKIFLKYLLGKI